MRRGRSLGGVKDGSPATSGNRGEGIQFNVIHLAFTDTACSQESGDKLPRSLIVGNRSQKLIEIDFVALLTPRPT
jgi:hypothetical protein